MPRVANRDHDLFTVLTHNPEAMCNTVRTSIRLSSVSPVIWGGNTYFLFIHIIFLIV